MQTVDYISAVKWIISQYSDDTRKLFQRGMLLAPSSAEERKAFASHLLRVTTDMAIVSERLNAHPLAPDVLRAYGMEALLDREFAIRVAERALALPSEDRGDRLIHLDPAWDAVTGGWWIIERNVAPLERLLLPASIANATDYDELFTLELRYEGDIYPKADTVSRVLRHAEALYSVVAKALGMNDYPQLVVVYADSGSTIRIDLRGLGEPIKQAKELLVEFWRRYRHRKAEDFRANAEAMLSGLNVITALDALHQKGTISHEDVARYKRDIIEAGLELFEDGAVPREVPRVEIVPNQGLLESIHRKLLPAGPSEGGAEPPSVTRPARRTSSSRRGGKKRK